MTINELREKRNQAWNAAKAFVETKRDKDGLLSDEDAATYAQMEKKVQDYGAEIERMEAMSAMEAQLNRPTSSPITEKPMNGKSTADEKPKTGRASDAYRTGMLTALRSNFHQVSDVLREGVDADGGYLVPEEYDSRLIQTLSEENIMRKLGHTITTSGEHKINIAATAPAAAWIEEGGALSFGDATFAQILLDAHKLHDESVFASVSAPSAVLCNLSSTAACKRRCRQCCCQNHAYLFFHSLSSFFPAGYVST